MCMHMDKTKPVHKHTHRMYDDFALLFLVGEPVSNSVMYQTVLLLDLLNVFHRPIPCIFKL